MKDHVLWGWLLGVAVIVSAGPIVADEPSASSPVVVSQNTERFSDRMDFANGLYARDMYDMALVEYDGIATQFASEPGISVAYLRAAESLFLSKKYDEAIARYRVYISRFPESLDVGSANVRIGEALYSSGRREEAEKHFLGLVDPSSSLGDRVANAAHYYLGKIYFEGGQTALAETHLRRTAAGTDGNPYVPFANFYLGEAALLRDDLIAAIAFYEKAVLAETPELKEVAKFGMGRALFLAGRTDDAKKQFEDVYTSPGESGLSEDAFVNYLNSLYKLEDFKTLIERAPSGLVLVTDLKKLRQVRFLIADAHARMGDRASAKTLYDQIASAPGTPAEVREKALLRRVETTVEGGDYSGAIRELEQLIREENIAKDPLLLLMANVLKRLDQPVEAMSRLDRLIREYPQSDHLAEAMLNKSYILIGLEKPKRARGTLQEFLKRFSDHPLAEKVLHDIVLLDIQLLEKPAAIAGAETFLIKYPKSSLAEGMELRLGSLYTDTGNAAAARETFENYVKTHADSTRQSEVYFLLGYNEQVAVQYAAAIGYYDKVEAAKVSDETAYAALKNRAYCSIMQSGFDAAARDYAAIIKNYPDNDLKPEAFFWLADYYLKKQDPASVRLTLESFAAKKEAASHKSELDYYTAESFRLEGKPTEAIASYTAAIDAKGLFVSEAHLGRGMAHAALLDMASAEADFNQALLNSGDDHEVAIRARSGLADMLYAKGDFHQAAKAFLAIGILYDDPSSVPHALMQAADAFERAGDSTHARQVYTELVQRFKDDPLALQASGKLKRE